MSNFEDLLAQVQQEVLNEKNNSWRKDPRYLAIRKITKEDLANGSAQIEKLDCPPWESKTKQTVKPAGLVGFGKHAQLTYQELREQQPGYFRWANENIKGFKEKADKFL